MYRFTVKHRGRLVEKRAPATHHVAYILRQEEDESAGGHVRYMLRASAATKGREDLVDHGHGNLPTWAHEDPLVFWDAAERYEGANRRTATTWEIAFPRGMTEVQERATLHDLLTTQFGERHPYTWAIHDAPTSDGGRNRHVHIAYSARMLDGIERPPAQFFRRWQADHPERGGARKDPVLTERWIVARQREAWAMLVNWHMERAGSQVRLDPRSLREQGATREATPYLPVGDFMQAKYRGQASEPLRARREGQATRMRQWQADTQRAAVWWTYRKAELGISRGMPHAALLRIVEQRSREPLIYRTGEELREEARLLQRAIVVQERQRIQQRSARVVAQVAEDLGTPDERTSQEVQWRPYERERHAERGVGW